MSPMQWAVLFLLIGIGVLLIGLIWAMSHLRSGWPGTTGWPRPSWSQRRAWKRERLEQPRRRGAAETTILLVLLICVAGCTTDSPDAPPDPAPTSCESTVIATCGPRPPRPSPQTEEWGHDIDLWAKCAESATPSVVP